MDASSIATSSAPITFAQDSLCTVTDEPDFVQPMAKLGAPIDYRDAPAFVDFLNKDAERISAAK